MREGEGLCPLEEASTLRCLVSHSESDHQVALRMQRALSKPGLAIEVDPFPMGVDIAARIQTWNIHVVLFLLSPRSWSSRWCREELDVAKARGIPVVMARLDGDVPGEIGERIYLDLASADEASLEEMIVQLEAPLRIHAELYKLVAAAGPDAIPEDSRRAAEQLAFGAHDPAVLAQFVQSISKQLCQGVDPTTQAWLAAALGKAGSREAAVTVRKLLQCLPSDIHPLVRRALEDAHASTPWQ